MNSGIKMFDNESNINYLLLAGFTIAGLWLFANAFIANKVSKDISSDAEIVFNTPFPFE